MGKWVTLRITAGPKQGVLEFLLHSKLRQSREEQSGHDSRTSEYLQEFKKQYRDWYYTNEATYYLADNRADTNTDH